MPAMANVEMKLRTVGAEDAGRQLRLYRRMMETFMAPTPADTARARYRRALLLAGQRTPPDRTIADWLAEDPPTWRFRPTQAEKMAEGLARAARSGMKVADFRRRRRG